MLRLLAIVFVLLTTGARASRGAWRSPAGTPDDEIRMTLYNCLRDSKATNRSGYGLSNGEIAGRIVAAQEEGKLFGQCMRAHGYHFDKNAEARIRL